MMAGEFAEAYERLADHTVVLDVYGAREDPVPGVTGALVADRFADPSRVDYLPDWQEAADQSPRIARDGDLVMTLGCGDVYRIIPQILDALARGGPVKRPEGFDGPTGGRRADALRAGHAAEALEAAESPRTAPRSTPRPAQQRPARRRARPQPRADSAPPSWRRRR